MKREYKSKAYEFKKIHGKSKTQLEKEMKQPDILENTNYLWKLKNGMILLLNENDQIVRKFKNSYAENEDFVTNIRIEIILRFGISPKLLKEAV